MKTSGPPWLVSSFTVCTMLLALCSFAEAQQAKRTVLIGYLGNEKSTPSEESFLQGLRAHGWIEGQNIVIERRYWESGAKRLGAPADELVRLKVDIIVTSTGTAALAVKKATSTIPIVMTASGDAVTQGLMTSLSRPGGNVTGLTNISPEVAGKRLELLKEAFPKTLRVAVLRCAQGTPISDAEWSDTEHAARLLKVQLQSLVVNGPQEIDRALRAATHERADALFAFDCPRIPTKTAAKIRLPAIYSTTRFADADGLMVYAPSTTDSAYRAATYVDKILKGTKPADLPVEQPKKFELVINLKTAKQIGLTIPPNVLARADKVIK
jgi:ABC-type uncharacterized transport system substrate-binding protein